MPKIALTVNGAPQALELRAGATLLDLLRDHLQLTGTKYGCGEGQCGTCTVLLDGRAVRACITPATAAQGKKVTTIEGLAANGRLHPMQQAFLEKQSFQCGYCTPGMIMGGAALLARTPEPAEPEIRAALNGHVCRCGTYPRIVEAVQLAARLSKEARRG